MDKGFINTFGEYIKFIRESKGLRLEDVAIKSKISISYLNRLERNERLNPSFSTITRLVNSLDISVIDLLQITLISNQPNGRDIKDVILEGKYVIEGKV